MSAVHRAAELMGVDPARLAGAVHTSQLQPWGRHQDGSAVFRWGELCDLAVHELGCPPPRRLWRDHQWSYEASARGRAARYAQELET